MAEIDDKHAVLIVTLQNDVLAAQKGTPQFQSNHDVNIVSKTMENGVTERSVRVPPVEIRPSTGAANVCGEE